MKSYYVKGTGCTVSIESDLIKFQIRNIRSDMSISKESYVDLLDSIQPIEVIRHEFKIISDQNMTPTPIEFDKYKGIHHRFLSPIRQLKSKSGCLVELSDRDFVISDRSGKNYPEVQSSDIDFILNILYENIDQADSLRKYSIQDVDSNELISFDNNMVTSLPFPSYVGHYLDSIYLKNLDDVKTLIYNKLGI